MVEFNKRFSKVVIVGGAGFVGREIIVQFQPIADNIVVIDNMRTGLRNKKELELVELIENDIRDLGGDWPRAFRGADLVIHLAANIDTPWSVKYMNDDFSLNALGTKNIVNACVAASVPKILYASSAAVYGAVTEDKLPITENIYPEPASPYAKTKFQGEIEVLAGARTYGYTAHCLRMFNIYGPWESPVTLDEVLLYTLYVLKNQEISIFGEPSNQVRDYVSVSDIARAYVLAAQSEKQGAFFYNIGSGKGTNFAELLSIIENVTGIIPQTKILPLRPGELTKSWGIYERAKEIIQYEHQVNIEEGVKQMVDWIKNAPQEVLNLYKLS
ncbi:MULTISPECIES: NAD(P)-dependent oxidoreductase [Okeania]|uniref:NAD-dependent epimerase/dehydratase family protein n=1 Tax=Okeania TaxID=1458928 RepID=UPI001375133B|nr:MULTISPECIES: NAD-dependent epimerase/dehydratase family protein [Okeania]NET14287.1 NAD-dependent epimerase/dehydratase family protein [Okeania sp. SIO1H6]NEP87633.1 NAD-dependent epimerase/dehydratase family protein [Okeania sp. SIO2C2]NES77152.1 NAD-dependent epimerase/dehydratase family protein [Okeania sp. SIO1H4]NES91788.1 NAD-dependent epimerase/dehydratase family protein [Okeania sp. SIO2B9]NET20758.1 NAD-dependent epimerase/dehydratase family protein [Okeania sp. SIO1H5]